MVLYLAPTTVSTPGPPTLHVPLDIPRPSVVKSPFLTLVGLLILYIVHTWIFPNIQLLWIHPFLGNKSAGHETRGKALLRNPQTDFWARQVSLTQFGLGALGQPAPKMAASEPRPLVSCPYSLPQSSGLAGVTDGIRHRDVCHF